jgi:hypothetical protein
VEIYSEIEPCTSLRAICLRYEPVSATIGKNLTRPLRLNVSTLEIEKELRREQVSTHEVQLRLHRNLPEISITQRMEPAFAVANMRRVPQAQVESRFICQQNRIKRALLWADSG